MSERENKLIDEIWTELSQKNVLNEVVFINLTKQSLEQLVEEYTDEFKNELDYSHRKVSNKDLEDYFKVSILVSPLKDGKNTNYLRRYSEIIKELSVNYHIPISEIEFMIDYFFITFKSYITNIWMPIIRITNLGTFKPTIGRMEWHIKFCIRTLRKKKHKNPERLKERIRHYWTVRRRLMDEKYGKNTWKEWRSKLKLEVNNDSQKESKKQKS